MYYFNFFFVLINGKAHGYFYSSKGIRQGDPPPPIFLLCMELLIGQLNNVALYPRTNVGLLTSPCSFKTSNFVFADDSLIFAKPQVLLQITS